MDPQTQKDAIDKVAKLGITTLITAGFGAPCVNMVIRSNGSCQNCNNPGCVWYTCLDIICNECNGKGYIVCNCPNKHGCGDHGSDHNSKRFDHSNPETEQGAIGIAWSDNTQQVVAYIEDIHMTMTEAAAAPEMEEAPTEMTQRTDPSDTPHHGPCRDNDRS